MFSAWLRRSLGEEEWTFVLQTFMLPVIMMIYSIFVKYVHFECQRKQWHLPEHWSVLHSAECKRARSVKNLMCQESCLHLIKKLNCSFSERFQLLWATLEGAEYLNCQFPFINTALKGGGVLSFPHHCFPAAVKLVFKQNYQIICESLHLNQSLSSSLSKLLLVIEE